MKFKNFYTAKGKIICKKHKPRKWENTFTNYAFNRGLISKTYKELGKLDNKKTNIPIKSEMWI